MNIFHYSSDPELAARDYCDNHLSAIPREIASMITNMFSQEELKVAPKTQLGEVRRHSYYNHPMSKWVRASKDNFDWTLRHYFGLIEEKRWRFPDRPPHFTVGFVQWAAKRKIDFEFDQFMVPPQCFNGHEECKRPDPTLGYRVYFCTCKRHLAKWTGREKPEWYI